MITVALKQPWQTMMSEDVASIFVSELFFLESIYHCGLRCHSQAMNSNSVVMSQLCWWNGKGHTRSQGTQVIRFRHWQLSSKTLDFESIRARIDEQKKSAKASVSSSFWILCPRIAPLGLLHWHPSNLCEQQLCRCRETKKLFETSLTFSSVLLQWINMFGLVNDKVIDQEIAV